MSDPPIVFLGNPTDPQPVNRTEFPDAFAWPDAAVFAITFERSRFPNFPWARYYGEVDHITEFYGADGWPVALRDELRALAPEVKRELQVFPNDWRNWRYEWEKARRDPGRLARLRAQGGIASFIARAVANG